MSSRNIKRKHMKETSDAKENSEKKETETRYPEKEKDETYKRVKAERATIAMRQETCGRNR